MLQKPLIPVLMFVEPGDLFGPIQKYQARVAETPAQIAQLVEELKRLPPSHDEIDVRLTPHFQLDNVDVSLDLVTPLRVPDGQTPAAVPSPESFTSSRDWESLLRVGEWARDADSGTILGEGTFRYLLSGQIYREPFTIRCRLTFLEMHPDNDIDSVNAGIVLGWRVPRQARQYYHLLFTGTQLLLEKIGARDGGEYQDFEHVDGGVPFRLEPNRPYDLSISVAGTAINVVCDGRRAYDVTLNEVMPPGRVGLRPWRSRLKCEAFVISGAV